MRFIAAHFKKLFSIFYVIALLLIFLLVSCSNDFNSQESSTIRSPKNLIANPGARIVELSWQGNTDPGVSYTVYWQVGNEMANKETAFSQQVSSPYFMHTNLSNGVTYYYRVSAHKDNSESALSDQVQAIPKQLPPEQPSLKQAGGDGFQGYAGDRVATLVWPAAVSEGASRYNILWQLGDNDAPVQRIDNVVSPYVHQGLINGQTYRYRLVGINDEGEGSPSEEVLVTPQQAVPAAPKNLEANVNSGNVAIRWDDVSNADRFEIYWNTVGNVSLTDNHISGVRSPFTHAPLINGQTYYYRIRALNDGGASALSGELALQPPDTASPSYTPRTAPALTAPEISGIGSNDSRLTISWSKVSNATGYNLYWNTTGHVTPADNKLANVVVLQDEGSNELRYVHTELVNGEDYFYRIAAFNDGDGDMDEILGSEAGPARPEKVIPGSPANVRAIAGDGWVGIRWNPVQNAIGYKLYWQEVNDDHEYIVEPIESPYKLDGLINGTTYELEVSASDLNGNEYRSRPVNVIPQINQPTAPQGIQVIPGDQEVTIQWDSNPPEESVSQYRVYFDTSPGVTPGANSSRVEPDTVISGTQIRHNQPPLTNGVRYYYIVTAVNAGGESVASKELWVIPNVPTPGAPTQFSARAGNTAVTLTWQPPVDVIEGQTVSYNLYWQEMGEQGRGDRVAVPNISSPYTFTGLQNNVTYYFQITATNEGGEGVFSQEIAATPFLPPPVLSLQIDSLDAGDGYVRLQWTDPNEAQNQLDPQQYPLADSYTLFWSTSPEIDLVYGPRITGLSQTSYLHEGLTNGVTHYYRLVAVNAGGQSPVSDMSFAEPQVDPPAQAPTNFVVLAGDTQVTLQWDAVAEADQYIVYWSTDPNRPLSQWASLQGIHSGDSHSELINGQRYYYYIRAANPGGEGPLSNIVNVMPQEPPPQAPGGIAAAADDAQAIINWTSRSGLSYHLYWSTTPGVTTDSSRIDNVQAAYVHTGLNNDSGPYYYRLQAENTGGLSPLSQEVSADPAPPVTGAPIGLSAQGRPQEVQLSWLPPAGADANTTYTLYWSLVPNSAVERIAIPNVRSPFVHRNLSNGTIYYYVITATNESGESPTSAQSQARPMPEPVNAPTTLHALAGQQRVSLQWNTVDGADRYYLYWSSNDTFNPVQRETIVAPTTEFTHSNLPYDTTYYYYVSAENLSGESAASYTVSATTALAPNQLPVIVQGSLISRNSSLGATISINLNANDPDGNALSWAVSEVPLQGTAVFNTTDGNDVVLSYTHTGTSFGQDTCWVQVTDSRGGSDTVQIVVTVSNQAPQFDPAIATELSIDENTTAIATINASDPEGNAVSYRLGGGVDAGLFSLDGQTGELRFINAPNYDIPADGGADNRYQVPIVIDDGSGALNAVVSKNFIVVVNNVNEPPTIISTPLTAALQNEAYAYALQIDDEDQLIAGDSFTYALVTAPQGMSIDVNGVIRWLPDNAAVISSPHAVQIEVRDSGNELASQSYSLDVVNANDAPTDILLDNTTVGESAANGSLVGTLSAIDPDNNDSHSFTLTADNSGGGFAIQGNQLIVVNRDLLDFETQPSLSIDVQVFDRAGLGLPQAKSFTISITDQNDAPQIAAQSITLTENTLLAGNIIASDQDNDTLSFSLVGGADAGQFTISSAGVVTMNNAPNYESPGDANIDNGYELVVSVFDGIESADAAITVRVTDAPEPPVITSVPGLNANQGQLYTYTVEAIDEDLVHGDSLRFSLVSKPNGMSINVNTGVVSWTPGADAVTASPHAVQVRVQDSTQLFAEQSFTVSVQPTNLPPTDVLLDNNSVGENVVNGTVVGTLSAEDPNAGDSHTFTLVSDSSSGGFAVQGDQLIVQDSALLDYETVAVHKVSIQATDSHGASLDVAKEITISLLDQNEQPQFIAQPVNQANMEWDTVSGITISASDGDNDTLSYSATGLPSGLSISTTGVITGQLSTTASANSPYTVRVTVDDQLGQANSTNTTTFQWMVNNFDHAPYAVQACASSGCHTVTTGLTYKPATHPLTTEVCEACHNTSTWAPLSAIDHAQTVSACVTCHNGSISSGKGAAHPLTSEVCDGCHSTINWVNMLPTIDHAQALGTCSNCHTKSALHITSTSNCAACHITTTWVTLNVDHAQTLGVCSDCHTLPGGHCDTVGEQCSTCHNTSTWLQATDCTPPIPPNQAPTAVIYGETTAISGEPLTFSGINSTDPDGDPLTYSWVIDGGAYYSGVEVSHTFSNTPSFPINIAVYLTVNDGVLNSQPAYVVVTVYPPAPSTFTTSTGYPQITNFDVPPSALLNTLVTAKAYVGSSGSVLRCAWDFGDGTLERAFNCTESNTADFTHIYNSVGTYTVTLSVFDGVLTSTAQSDIVIGTELINFPPTANINIPLTSRGVLVNTPIDFSGTGIDAIDTPDEVSYLWSFGTGSGIPDSNLRSPAVSYQAAGTYTVKLTVTDSGGLTATNTRTIVVVEDSWGSGGEPVENDDVDYATSPSIAIDGASNVFAVWSQRNRANSTRYDAVVGAWGVAQEINSNVGMLYSKVVAHSDGTAIAVWKESNDLMYNRYDPGVGWRTPQADVENSPNPITDFEMAKADNGDIRLIWSDNDTIIKGNTYSFATKSWASDQNLEATIDASSNPKIAIGGTSGDAALTIWVRNGNIFSNYVAGTSVGWDPIEAQTVATGSNSRPEVVVFSDNTGLAVWYASGIGLRWSLFDNQATTQNQWSTSQLLSPATDFSNPLGLVLGVDNLDRVTLLFRGTHSDGRIGIWACRYVSATGWSAPELISHGNLLTAGYFPALAVDAGGNAIAAWTQGGDVWANSYNEAKDQWGVPRLVEFDSSSNGTAYYTPALEIDNNGVGVVLWEQDYNGVRSILSSRLQDLIEFVASVDIPIFENNGLYSLLRTNCSGCHDPNAIVPMQPYFATNDVTLSYDAIVNGNLVNLNSPSSSRLYVRLATDGHNCWSDCASNGNEILTLINDWASLR